jgi:hypothetical protein
VKMFCGTSDYRRSTASAVAIYVRAAMA